jgi:diadenosine tetraphosphate (Ap4A) HIT family hydrolase
MPDPDCLICVKHSAADPGLEVHRSDLVYVGHLPGSPDAYLGHLFVEPLSHRPGLADLAAGEAAAVGEAIRRTSVALKSAGCDHVYAFVYGDAVPHLHVHLLGRHPDAPPEYRGVKVDEWPDAPRGDAADIATYVARLRTLWSAAG